MTDNLYAAPQSNLERPNPNGNDGFLAEPLARGAGAAMGWISKGWTLFKLQPVPWLLLGAALLLCLIVVFVVALIPILGSLVQMVVQFGMIFVMPAILAGFYMAMDRVNRGEQIEFGQLFGGFRTNFGQLVMVGLLNFGASMIFGIIFAIGIGIVVASTIGLGAFTGQSGGNMDAFGVVAIVLIAILVLFAIVAGFVINMLFWFAPMLVAMNNMTAVDAVKLSWKASKLNFGGYLVYMLLTMLLVLAGYITCGLGLLVVMPVLVGASYSAYREIFYGD